MRSVPEVVCMVLRKGENPGTMSLSIYLKNNVYVYIYISVECALVIVCI
jgi:hypothetical protein